MLEIPSNSTRLRNKHGVPSLPVQKLPPSQKVFLRPPFVAHTTSISNMPASQLSQLKAALSGAGLDRKSVSKKDKKAFKKGGARETDRQKKFDKLDDIRKGLNKFDERETKVSWRVQDDTTS